MIVKDEARLIASALESVRGLADELVVVDEYDGPVDSTEAAARAVASMGGADMALLANHGVFVTAGSIRAAHQRAVALEQRCRNAWHVRAAGGDGVTVLPERFLERMVASDGEGFHGFFEAAVRAELRADPTLLD